MEDQKGKRDDRVSKRNRSVKNLSAQAAQRSRSFMRKEGFPAGKAESSPRAGAARRRNGRLVLFLHVIRYEGLLESHNRSIDGNGLEVD